MDLHIKAIDSQINNYKNEIMNLKRFFGALLTVLGIAALIYAALLFTNTSGSNQDIKSLIIYGILGSIFFTSGISLVRTTKDES
jgi:uncharacterized membrane protein